MFLFDEKESRRLVFVDIETTGSRVGEDKITEIGVLVYEDGELVRSFSTLLNPRKYIDSYITYITGITNEMVKNSPTFEEISNELHEILKDRVFVAHNVGFDYSFIKKEFERIGMNFSSDQLCTVKLSRYLYPEHRRHNLDEIISRMEISCENRHRAYDDAEVIFKFFNKCCEAFPKDVIDEAIKWSLRKQS